MGTLQKCLREAVLSGPEVIFFFMLNSTEDDISTLILIKYRQIKKFFALCLSGVVFIMLINVKIPTTGILTFMSRLS